LAVEEEKEKTARPVMEEREGWPKSRERGGKTASLKKTEIANTENTTSTCKRK